MAEYFSIMYIPHRLYLLSVNGHLGGFHVLAVVSSAAMNIGVHETTLVSYIDDIVLIGPSEQIETSLDLLARDLCVRGGKINMTKIQRLSNSVKI